MSQIDLGSIGVSNSGTTAAPAKTNRSVSSNTTVAINEILIVNTSGGAITVTMPSSPQDGDEFGIKDEGGNFQTNNCTLARASSEKIENVAANKTLQTNYGFWLYRYKTATTNWMAV